MEKKFKVGEVVWAKVKGYPWWPGLIGKIDEQITKLSGGKVLVNFIGDSSHAEIAISKIEKFDRKYSEFSRTKKRALAHSIELAKKIQNKEISPMTSQNNKNISTKVIKEQRESECGGVVESGLLKKKKKRFMKENIKVKRHLLLNKINSRKRGVTNFENYENSQDLEELIKSKINEVVFLKVELPSSTSNRSIIHSLETIGILLSKLKSEQFFEMIKDLSQLLRCLSRSNSVSIAADKLMELIKRRIVIELFEKENFFLENEKSEDSEEMEALESYSNDAIYGLMAYIEKNSSSKKLSKIFTPGIGVKNLEDEILLKRVRNSPTKQVKSRKKREWPLQNYASQSMGIEMEESNSFCESSLISSNSSKTDCEESKSLLKAKVKIIPLDQKNSFFFLQDCLEKDFTEEQQNNCTFTNEELQKILDIGEVNQSVKYPYLRRRVCYKLFKVLNILLKNLKLDSGIVKNISIYLELKARERDPLMKNKYKGVISLLFLKIRDKLTFTSENLVELE